MTEAFEGTARYRIRRRIGTGGTGVVYQAYDKVRCVDVALKTLRASDPNAIYRLKREFRALTDVSHPNLITLHELVKDNDVWFVAMELIGGVDLIAHVREDGAFKLNTLTSGEFFDATLEAAEEHTLEEAHASEAETEVWDRPSSIVNIRRLRRVLLQVVEGLRALHAAGIVHRDIKPPNVLVDESGRAVVLDFGLVAETTPMGLGSTTEGITGTPAYMAPEQASGRAVTTAADWYSLGVVLYEALTGQLPFPGKGVDALMQKMHDTPLIPSTIAPGTPIDLNVLCMEMLSRDPADRPSGSDILQRIAPDRRPVSTARGTSIQTTASVLVGRDEELTALNQAFERTLAGQPASVLIRGHSGMGKTTLARHFVEQLGVDHDDVVVLAGRCYERETVPFKAIDSVIDRLAHFLTGLDQLEVEALLPRDVRALTRVFPVLERVESIAVAPATRAKVPDPHELRRRAFKALKELLSRITDRRSLVISIDDLQWGDADSALLLLDLMRPPEPPPFLLVGCYRSEDEASAVLVQELLGGSGSDATRPVALQRPVLLALDPLDDEDSTRLASRIISGTESQVRRRAATIVQEAAGNPFLIEALAGFSERHANESAEMHLDVLLRHRIARLSRDARNLLEIVAIAGRPLAQQVAFRAAGIDVAAESAALTEARSANQVRTSGSMSSATVVTYHDRIREHVVSEMSPERRQARHRSLALTLETFQPDNPQAVHLHHAAAGNEETASRYAERAGDDARKTLAFDHASRLYRTALNNGLKRTAEERRALLVKLGEALAHTARGTEAGAVFLEAADDAPENEALDLRRRATEQWLISGRIGRGGESLARLLDSIGARQAPTPADAVHAAMEQRKAVVERGLSYEPRDAADIPERDLLEIDILRTVAMGFLAFDTAHGVDFQTRHLQRALEAGEPVRVARALALEATYAALGGGRARSRVDDLTTRAVELSKSLGDPRAIGACALAIGLSAHFMGQWPRAARQLRETEKLLRERCTDVAWELSTARVFSLMVRFYVGDVRELIRLTPAVIEDADARGDLYTSSACRLGHLINYWLIHDQPDEAVRQLDAVTADWPQAEFTVQRHLELSARCTIDLYAGRDDAAFARLPGLRSAFAQSQLEKVQFLRVDALYLEGRIALAAARTAAESSTHLESALGAAERLEAENVGWALAFAKLLRGCVALGSDDEIAAGEAFERALTACESVGMALHATAARYRLGQLVGEERGDDLLSGAQRWLKTQGVTNPARMFDLIVPDPRPEVRDDA